MARSKHKETLTLDHVADYGPSVRRDREGKFVSSGPGVVTMEDREDISATLNREARRPLVRGARRWDALRSLVKVNRDGKIEDDVITAHGYAAAIRFLDDCSRAQGGSQASFLAIVVSGGSGLTGPSDDQQKALRAIMRVRLMLGLNPDTVFWQVVLENRTPDDFDTRFGLKHGTGAKWLKAALTALDEHYNGSSSRSRDGIKYV